MKKLFALAIAISIAISLMTLSCDSKKGVDTPDLFTYHVFPHYKKGADGNAGREILLKFNKPKDFDEAMLSIKADNKKVLKITCKANELDSMNILLPDGVSVDKDASVTIDLSAGEQKLTQTFSVPAKRQWKVYIYPHSHVDIGYTNTQENVELIHKRNLKYGIELAEKTKDYPEGARFIWNPEVTWPIERYMNSEPESEKQKLLDAIKKGYIRVDAGYVSTNTSAAADEELLELMRYSKDIEKLTGEKVKTLVQVDIPGVSWGMVSSAAQMGVPYCLALFNGYDRVGLAYELNFKPFWWQGPDGKSKILFLQPGSYNPGALLKGHLYWPSMAGQTDTSKLLKIVKTDTPRKNFIDGYLWKKTEELEQTDYYPYDIFPMTWCMADNTPIDADLPEAVKSWNEEFAYPQLIICSATEMMEAFDKKYGDQLPVLSGDFTEYWTDGLGSEAKRTGMNRTVKERLIQTETLWSLLRPNETPPRSEIIETWRNIILGTEHTWAFMDPGRQPISGDILKVKFGYFETADKMSRELLAKTLPDNGADTLIAVINTHSWAIEKELVILDKETSKNFNSVYDTNHKPVLSQRLTSGELAFMAENIPALGHAKYILSKNKSTFTGSFAKGNELDNGITKVVLDPQWGDITSIIFEGQEFADSKAKSAINSYRYVKGEDTEDKAGKPSNVKITIKENGPLLSSLLVSSKAEGCNSLTREIRLIAGLPHLELNNVADKIATTDKEGIHFGFAFDIPSPVTKVDIPWAIMEVEKDQIYAGNRNWIAFQRWLNISNENKGVTWCSLDACVFESGNITANILGGATESPKWIRKLEPSATVYSWALNNHWHTNFPLSQKGLLPFRYRILPHNSAFDASVSNRFGMQQIQPLIVANVMPDFDIKTNFSIDASPLVVLSMLKTVEGGKSSIVRLRSLSSTEEPVKLAWGDQQPKALYVCEENEDAGRKIETGEIVMPPMSFISLKAEW